MPEVFELTDAVFKDTLLKQIGLVLKHFQTVVCDHVNLKDQYWSQVHEVDKLRLEYMKYKTYHEAEAKIAIAELKAEIRRLKKNLSEKAQQNQSLLRKLDKHYGKNNEE